MSGEQPSKAERDWLTNNRLTRHLILARPKLLVYAKLLTSPEYKAFQEETRRRQQELIEEGKREQEERVRQAERRFENVAISYKGWESQQRIAMKRISELVSRIEPVALGQNQAAASDSAEPADKPTPTKTKQSTERGEAELKLIAALTTHHKYADGGCLNPEPIGNNELARLAGVSKSTGAEFFKKEFGGHRKYRAMCADPPRLVTALQLLNGDVSPHLLFSKNPPGEGQREDDH